jgi:hypothetical protein
MPVSLHKLIRDLMGSFPAMFIAPSQNREYPDTFLHSVEVVTCTHKRSKPCCTSELLAHPHFSCVGPSRWSKPITVLLRNPADTPFCKSTRTYTTYVDRLPHRSAPLHYGSTIGRPFWTPLCPHLYTIGRLFWVTLTIHHRPPYCGTFRGSTSPIAPPADNSYDLACPLWTQYRGIFTGIPPSCCPRQDVNSYGKAHSLICERKKTQLTSPSHSRSYGWLLFTTLESLATLVINPRWTFQL